MLRMLRMLLKLQLAPIFPGLAALMSADIARNL